MATQLETLIADYRANVLPLVVDPEEPDRKAARKKAAEIVRGIVKIQQSLKPDERLVLISKLSNLDEEEPELPNNLASDVWEERRYFTKTLVEAAIAKRITLEGVNDITQLPSQIEVSIPPDYIPPAPDAGGGHLSAVEEMNLFNKMHRFIDIHGATSTLPLRANGGGFFDMENIVMHSSNIVGFRIDTVEDNVNAKTKVLFRAIPQTQ